MSTKRKVIALGTDARERLIRGVDFLADAVQSTLGPFGQNFVLEKGEKVTNDGKNIAVEMECRDEIEQRGLSMMRKASIQTEQEVKDASTTSIVLGRAILKEAVRNLPTSAVAVGKMTVSEVVERIESERRIVEKALDSMAEPVDSMEKLEQAVLVSTENGELAKTIAGAQWKLGRDGIIVADEHIGKSTEVEYVSGILIDNGMATSQVITNQEKQSLELGRCRIILTNNTVETIEAGKDSSGKTIHRLPIEGLVKELHSQGENCVVFMARAFTSEAIACCMEYTRQGFGIFPVNAPYLDQAEVMRDMESVLGGRFVDIEAGSLATISAKDLGTCTSVSVERWRATFSGSSDDETRKRVDGRVAALKEKLSGRLSDFEHENLEKRIAQLTNGFAIVRVGAVLDTTRKRLKDKADDAVGTARSALLEGVVRGGGIALMEASKSLPDDSILGNALASVNRQIMSTSPKGFEIAEWVKDPLRTVKVALKYACEAASNLATAAGAIATEFEKPKKDDNE